MVDVSWGKTVCYCLLGWLLSLQDVLVNAGTPLTEYITHYEPLYYDHTHLEKQHHIVKRSANKELTMDFSALGREFKIGLYRDPGIYTSDLVVETSDAGPVYYDSHRAYIGYLKDDLDSFVHGTLTSEGHFEGKVITHDDQYIIERSTRFFTSPQEFHSIIYRHSDVSFDQSATKCLSDQLHQKIYNIQKSEFRTNTSYHGYSSSSPDDTQKTRESNSAKISDADIFRNLTMPNLAKNLRDISLDVNGHVTNTRQHTRIKRENKESIRNLFRLSLQKRSDGHPRRERSKDRYLHRSKRHEIDPTKTTCLLYMQADHLFYKKQGYNVEAVIEQLTQHVQGVNAIYRIIDFDKDAVEDNINFIIKRIKVHTNPYIPGYKYNGRFGVEKYLELFSEDNYNDFCLAYMFTYRDFDGGTLGLAWTGDLQNAGGVCEQNGFFRGSMKSLNSGIVTTLNYGKDVPSTVSHVTLAHEIGHNMGSQHDPETMDCAPGGEPGNYIMFARATSGDKPNNNKFSQCSKDSMSMVIAAKARSSSGCFIVYTGAICGNEIVEPGEQCDCGWEGDCREDCCYPQKSNPHPAEPPCTLRPGAVCSPSEGPCCTPKCRLVGRSAYQVCREETSCTKASYCDGFTAPCPDAAHKPNRTHCDEDSVCYQGECTGSICLVYGLESCQCEPKKVGDWTDRLLCHLCCKQPGEGKPCKTSKQWNRAPYNVPDIMAKPGMPCNNYMGYCDVYSKCREVDPSGPLSILRRYLFSEKGRENMKEWVIRHWYVVGGIGLALLIFLGLFVKLCSKTLPRRKRGQKWTNQGGEDMTELSTKGVYPGIPRSGSSPKPLTSAFGYPGPQKYGAVSVMGTRFSPKGLSPYGPDVIPEQAVLSHLVASPGRAPFISSSPYGEHAKHFVTTHNPGCQTLQSAHASCCSSSANSTPQIVHTQKFVIHPNPLSPDFMPSAEMPSRPSGMTSPEYVVTSSQGLMMSSEMEGSSRHSGMTSPEYVVTSTQGLMMSSAEMSSRHSGMMSPEYMATSTQGLMMSSDCVLTTASGCLATPKCANMTSPRDTSPLQNPSSSKQCAKTSSQCPMTSSKCAMTSSDSVHNPYYRQSSPSVVRMSQQILHTPSSSTSSPAGRNRKRQNQAKVKGQGKKGWV